MRFALLLLAVPALLTTGCSIIVAEVGTPFSEYETRDKAHKVFGEPVRVGFDDSRPFEDFYTRRKLSDGGTLSDFTLLLFTLGFSELYRCPVELVRLTRTTLMGQTIRLTYDEDGKVKDTNRSIKK